MEYLMAGSMVLRLGSRTSVFSDINVSMSSPSDIAMGIMAHSLVALLSKFSQAVLSPTVAIGGALGIFITALPTLQAQRDAARTM